MSAQPEPMSECASCDRPASTYTGPLRICRADWPDDVTRDSEYIALCGECEPQLRARVRRHRSPGVALTLGLVTVLSRVEF
jgi:hypothetical protein